MKSGMKGLPDFAEGYALWKTDWDEAKAGYFTAALKDILEGRDQGMKKM